MSEKIFACLFRLYPGRFREEYEQDVMQGMRWTFNTARFHSA